MSQQHVRARLVLAFVEMRGERGQALGEELLENIEVVARVVASMSSEDRAKFEGRLKERLAREPDLGLEEPRRILESVGVH